MCMSPSRLRCPSQGCAPSFGAAFMALVPRRRAGGRCTRTPRRASALPRAKPAPAAFTMQSWTSGASCTAMTSLSR
eukprot:6839961-Alexandrium_andersonii.AAC.1